MAILDTTDYRLRLNRLKPFPENVLIMMNHTPAVKCSYGVYGPKTVEYHTYKKIPSKKWGVFVSTMKKKGIDIQHNKKGDTFTVNYHYVPVP